MVYVTLENFINEANTDIWYSDHIMAVNEILIKFHYKNLYFIEEYEDLWNDCLTERDVEDKIKFSDRGVIAFIYNEYNNNTKKVKMVDPRKTQYDVEISAYFLDQQMEIFRDVMELQHRFFTNDVLDDAKMEVWNKMREEKKKKMMKVKAF